MPNNGVLKSVVTSFVVQLQSKAFKTPTGFFLLTPSGDVIEREEWAVNVSFSSRHLFQDILIGPWLHICDVHVRRKPVITTCSFQQGSGGGELLPVFFHHI